MTYKELKVNTEIKLREKPDGERVPSRMVKCKVIKKYPSMCIVEDKKGRRRGVAVGELIMNKVITQEPCLESLRKECGGNKIPRGWHKQASGQEAEYAP